jgi:hypothetical protein
MVGHQYSCSRTIKRLQTKLMIWKTIHDGNSCSVKSDLGHTLANFLGPSETNLDHDSNPHHRFCPQNVGGGFFYAHRFELTVVFASEPFHCSSATTGVLAGGRGRT